MNKIRVGFEVENVWNREDFREFIGFLMIDDADTYDLHIYSNPSDPKYPVEIGTGLGINPSNIHIYTSDAAKEAGILGDNIDIYLDNNLTVLNYLNASAVGTPLKPYGILVDFKRNQNALMLYIQKFQRWITYLNSLS